MTEQQQTEPTPPQQSDSTLAIVSMVLGVMSLTGPGLLFGIPAIVLAVIALKRHEAQRGLSITGLVTGIISTVISLLVIGFIIFAVIWAASHPESIPDAPRDQPTEQLFDSSKT